MKSRVRNRLKKEKELYIVRNCAHGESRAATCKRGDAPQLLVPELLAIDEIDLGCHAFYPLASGACFRTSTQVKGVCNRRKTELPFRCSATSTASSA